MDEPSKTYGRRRGCLYVLLTCRRLILKYVPSGQFSEMSGRGIAGKAAWWAPTPVRRLRTIAITHQHLLLLALLLASPVMARAAEGTATVPRFEPASCPKLQGAEALAEASCGYLVVPEDRSRPSGRTIRLMVAKYPAHSSVKRRRSRCLSGWWAGRHCAPGRQRAYRCRFHPRPGHTGGEPTRHHVLGAGAYLRDHRPVQPGASRPSLLFRATKRAHLAATEACHRELAATGADLSAYNSTENAADFADLRKVLGITTWNVYGTSYGSYLAQTLMRGHPEGIRSVVLDLVLPTTYTIPGNWWITHAGFDNLFQACAAETACNAAHPHLEKTFTGLVNKLEAEPLTTTVSRPRYRQTPQNRARRRRADRLAAQPELCRALAPRRAGSDRWARRRPA